MRKRAHRRPRRWLALVAAVASIVAACPDGSEERATYLDPGISQEEIVFGSSVARSGRASADGVIARAIEAYFRYINIEEGGAEMKAFDGERRRIRFSYLDDGDEPPQTLANVRRLVEREEVFGIFGTLGTRPNMAVREFLNEREVPHLFVASGASIWGAAHEEFPWTMGWQPAYPTEAAGYAAFLRDEHPDADVAVLYQNDDYGRDYLRGFEAALAGGGVDIVARQSYDTTDPSVDPQVSALASSGADTFFNITTPEFAVQAIRRAHEIGWEPVHLLNSGSASVSSVLRPAGLEASQGLITARYFKDPSDPRWDDDPGVQRYRAILTEHVPELDPDEELNAYGLLLAQTLVATIERMEEPTREGLMEAARNLPGLELGLLSDGIRVRTGPDDHFPVEAHHLHRFEGEAWVPFGDVLDFTGRTLDYVPDVPGPGGG